MALRTCSRLSSCIFPTTTPADRAGTAVTEAAASAASPIVESSRIIILQQLGRAQRAYSTSELLVVSCTVENVRDGGGGGRMNERIGE